MRRAPTPLISRTEILQKWTAQNGRLVTSMRSEGRLKDRLKESLDDALSIAANAINRGFSFDQAQELAYDAIALQPSQDDKDEDEDD